MTMGFKGIQGGGWRISDTGLTPSVLSSPGHIVKVEFCIKRGPNLITELARVSDWYPEHFLTFYNLRLTDIDYFSNL